MSRIPRFPTEWKGRDWLAQPGFVRGLSRMGGNGEKGERRHGVAGGGWRGLLLVPFSSSFAGWFLQGDRELPLRHLAQRYH